MASITKRKDTQEVSWQAIVRRRGYPQQSKAFPTRAEAEAWAGAIEADMRKGVYQSTSEAERTTLGDLISRFKEEFAPFHYRRRARLFGRLITSVETLILGVITRQIPPGLPPPRLFLAA